MHTFFSFIFKFNIPSYDTASERTLAIKQRGVHYGTGVSLAAKTPLSLSPQTNCLQVQLMAAYYRKYFIRTF